MVSSLWYKFPALSFMIILPTEADLSHTEGWTGIAQQSPFLQPFTNVLKNCHKERLKNIVLVAVPNEICIFCSINGKNSYIHKHKNVAFWSFHVSYCRHQKTYYVLLPGCKETWILWGHTSTHNFLDVILNLFPHSPATFSFYLSFLS